MKAPKCASCGKPLRRYRHRGVDPAKQWGDYGDGFLCGLRCGYVLAMRVLLTAQQNATKAVTFKLKDPAQ